MPAENPELATKTDIEAVQADVKTVHADIRRLETRLDTHDVRFDAIDKRFDAADERFERLTAAQVRTGAKLDKFKEEILERISESHSKLMDTMNAFIGETRTVDRRQVITSHRVDKLEERVDRLESR